MSFLKRLGSLFGGQEENADVIWLYVRCQRCGTVVRVRVDCRYDLNPDETGSGYTLVKEIMDDRCYQLMRAEIHLDENKRIDSSEISGGTFITEEEYEAAKSG